MTVLSKTERNMRDYGVAWFKFDEPSGNITDGKGTAVGTINGGVTRVTGWNGQGNALSFNGSTGYVQFNQRVIPIGEKSIRCKFKTGVKPSSGSASTLLGTSGGTSTHGTNIYINPLGHLKFQSDRGVAGSARFEIEIVKDVSDNQWHETLLTWDGTVNANSVKIFIDDMSNPIFVGTAASIETVQSSSNLAIGRQAVNPNFFFNGQIDEVEIYNKVIYPYDKQFLLSKDNLIFTAKSNQIVELDDTEKSTFVDYGFDGNYSKVDSNVIYNEIQQIKTNSQALGNGKIFAHTLDLDKLRSKKISF